MLHYIELIQPYNTAKMAFGLLALAVIPCSGNVIGVPMRRESVVPAETLDIHFDIRAGVNASSLVSIFANPDHRPLIPAGTLVGGADAAAFPIPVTALDSIGFYYTDYLLGGGKGYGLRPTAIVIIDDGLLNETSLVKTTGSLADGATENSTASLGKSFVLSKIAADRACRVRAYRSPAYRTADAARAIGIDPIGEHGVIVDCNIIGANLTLDLSPIVFGSTSEVPPSGNIALAIENKSGGASPVEVTFTLNKFEE